MTPARLPASGHGLAQGERRFARSPALGSCDRWRPVIASMLAAIALAVAPGLPAQTSRPLAEDPVLEAEVMRIAADLRCLVCQNETIAASHADLAVDLRGQIRKQLREGRDQDQILAYMVQRYGDFVLYKPPLKPLTLVLWLGPFVLLAAMLAVLWRVLRRRDAAAPPAPLSDAEHRRARELLGRTDADTR